MAKKSFKDNLTPAMKNPALDFITMDNETEETEITRPSKKETENTRPMLGYKRNPEYIETRSKRIQLLIQPSLYDRIKAKLEKGEGNSINDIIHHALEREFPETK